MTDFEKYPKYLLNKHGIIIQNILSNAESVFNLDANPNDENDVVQLQAPVKGGEFLKNSANASPIFEDAIATHTDADTGITAIGLKLDPTATQPDMLMAIANFADDEAISQLFNTNNSSNLAETLATPEITFNDDYTMIELSTEGASLPPMYYLLTTTEHCLSTEAVDYKYFNAATTEFVISSPIIDDYSKLQVFTVTAVGDSFNTKNSEPSNTLKKLFLAAPKISFISESGDGENEQHTYNVSYLDNLQPENVTINSKYYHTRYNYMTNTVTKVEESPIELGSSTNVTLCLGDTLTGQTTATTTDDTVIINNTAAPATLYKYVSSAPNPQKIKSGSGFLYRLSPDQYRNEIAYTYTDLDQLEKINNIIFICRIKKSGQTEFGAPITVTADCQNVSGNWQDEVIDIKLDIGDILEVSATAANFFYPSDIATIEVTDSEADSDVIDVATASFYNYDLEAGWSTN